MRSYYVEIRMRNFDTHEQKYAASYNLEMYNKQLARAILLYLDEEFPVATDLPRLQLRLPDFQGLNRQDWLTALDALLKMGWIEGVPMKGVFGLDDLTSIAIAPKGQDELKKFTSETKSEAELVKSNSDRLVFLSHANADEEIAAYLKKVLMSSLSGIDVFVSSDPEDVESGSEWPAVVLKNLRVASVLLLLATERGMSRKWVWFEAGAAWRVPLPLTPCCLGKVRAGQLPPPFFSYQGHNIDNEIDLSKLLSALATQLDVDVVMPDVREVARNLIRLDVRAEERIAVVGPFDDARRRHVRGSFDTLAKIEKEAIRQLLVLGDLTTEQIIKILAKRGFQANEWTGFPPIAANTSFVDRVWPFGPQEGYTGYLGPWTINPRFKQDLEVLFRDSEA
jgi:hypothetical protein